MKGASHNGNERGTLLQMNISGAFVKEMSKFGIAIILTLDFLAGNREINQYKIIQDED